MSEIPTFERFRQIQERVAKTKNKSKAIVTAYTISSSLGLDKRGLEAHFAEDGLAIQAIRVLFRYETRIEFLTPFIEFLAQKNYLRYMDKNVLQELEIGNLAVDEHEFMVKVIAEYFSEKHSFDVIKFLNNLE